MALVLGAILARDAPNVYGLQANIGILADMGVLYNLSKPNMLDVLTRSGLSHLTQKELAKIMEAAILISSVSLPLPPTLDLSPTTANSERSGFGAVRLI